MARIIIASASTGRQLEVEQTQFDEGFFPNWYYVSAAPLAATTEPTAEENRVAGYVSAGGSGPLPTAMRAAYATVQRGRPGNYTVFLGDSLTVGHDDPANGVHGNSWPTYAGLLSGQRIQVVYNAGITGNTSGDMLARFDTDVTAHGPSMVTLCAGANDVPAGLNLTQYQTNIKALIGKIRAIGAGPVLCTIPPNNDATRKPTITLWNTWLRLYASQQGIPLLDFFTVLVDPATGSYQTGYNSGDGTHPTDAGYAAMGAHAASVLAPQLPSAYPPLPAQNNESANLLTNGLFITAGTGGYAGSWGLYGSAPTGATPSVVTDSNVLGQMQRADLSASSGDLVIAQGLGAPGGGKYDIGDVLAVSGVVSNSGIGADMHLLFYPSAAWPVGISQNVTRGVFYAEVTVPANAAACDILLFYRQGTGSAQFGRLGVYNLTKLGLR